MAGDIHKIGNKKIYGMKQQWEIIEACARIKGVDLGKTINELASSLTSSPVLNNVKKKQDAREILELTVDPSVITQILEVCPDFFTSPYIIAKLERTKKLSPLTHATQISIIKKSEAAVIDIDHIDNYLETGILEYIVKKNNILIIPIIDVPAAFTNSDRAHQLLILDKQKDGPDFKVKYSNAMDSYDQVSCDLGSPIGQEEIFQIQHTLVTINDLPYIAITNKEINGFYYMHPSDVIKKIQE